VSRPLAPLALTMGEPAGVGGEIAAKAWAARRSAGLAPFFLAGDPRALPAGTPHVEIAAAGEAMEAFERGVPVLLVPLAASPRPGEPDQANAPAVLEAIRRAVACAQSGEAAAVVTNPIQKSTLYRAGFRHPGHTEFLAELTGAPLAVMMLACPQLRVVPVTVHRPLKAALAELSREAIVAQGLIVAEALARDFGCRPPRLAVAGLNPHAGEGGELGREEIEIIAPAVAALRLQGVDAQGPLSPDAMFAERARWRYDAALCMYHDQALIPLKALDFEGGVNVTLGLPIVRTSPDHGTALDLAGSGRASPNSLIAALKLAAEIARRRAG
jgi:4-hydroxythreonine-4-phosphate dehydrogenase